MKLEQAIKELGLPRFLYEDWSEIRTGYHGGTLVTEEWNTWLTRLSSLLESDESTDVSIVGKPCDCTDECLPHEQHDGVLMCLTCFRDIRVKESLMKQPCDCIYCKQKGSNCH